MCIYHSFIQSVEVPHVLYECVVEVDERIVLHQDSCQLMMNFPTCVGITGEKVTDLLLR